jgi:hypothetical protein
MIHRMVAAIMILLLSFISGITLAGENQTAREEKKSITTSGKCWKRVTWVDRTTSVGDGTRAPVYERSDSPVCMDFEKLLNVTCEPPDKLQCNWTLPLGEKGFKKLEWKAIDPKEHWNLIKDMVLSGWNEKYKAGQWEKLEPEYKRELEKGLLELKVTQADIDHDGKKDQIVLFRKGHCGKLGEQKIFGVIDQHTGNIDNNFRQVVLGLGGSRGDIITYDNYTVMFGWDSGIDRVMVWEGFNTITGKGSMNVCQFKYIKGGVK